MGDVQLPYSMQNGSGTMGSKLGFTYHHHFEKFSLGIQNIYTAYFGHNKQSYRIGNQFDSNLWLARQVSSTFSLSARLNWNWNQGIQGRDRDLMITPMMNPLADPNSSGGTILTSFLGANWVVASSSHNSHRIGLEIGAPLNQNLKGIQMKRKLSATIGYQVAF